MALDAVHRHGSLAAGARALQWSQPTIAHHLGAIERELGGLVAIRSSGGATLTPLGELALEHSEVILAEVNRLEIRARAFVGNESASLRIGVIPTVGAQLLAPALVELETTFSITVAEAENETLNGEVLSGALDIAIVSSGPLLNEHGRKIEVGRDQLLLAVRADSALARHSSTQLADLAGEHWILAKSADDAADRALLYAAKDAGFEPNVSRRSDNYLTVLGFVAAGFGIALVPELASRSVPAGVALVRVEPQIERTIWAVPRPGLRTDIATQVASVFGNSFTNWVHAPEKRA